MLIIFDLDDTLVDTTATLTPARLELALDRMVEAGLKLDNQGAALQLLQQLNLKAASAGDALTQFLDHVKGPPQLLSIGMEHVYDTFSEDLSVLAVEGAHTVLSQLQTAHCLAIVSVGKEAYQLWKLKKAGIDSTIFSKIVITPQRNKGACYEEILEEAGYDPSETVVCGDRIEVDLAPAKQLGCYTVQLRKGRGLNEKPSGELVDFSIDRLQDILTILDRL